MRLLYHCPNFDKVSPTGYAFPTHVANRLSSAFVALSLMYLLEAVNIQHRVVAHSS